MEAAIKTLHDHRILSCPVMAKGEVREAGASACARCGRREQPCGCAPARLVPVEPHIAQPCRCPWTHPFAACTRHAVPRLHLGERRAEEPDGRAVRPEAAREHPQLLGGMLRVCNWLPRVRSWLLRAGEGAGAGMRQLQTTSSCCAARRRRPLVAALGDHPGHTSGSSLGVCGHSFDWLGMRVQAFIC